MRFKLLTPTRPWILIAMAVTFAVVWSAHGRARPFRGGISWAFLLCKFSDSPAPPHSVTYYRNMMIASGTKGLNDYVKAISNGTADLSGSVIHGWYTEPHTLAHESGLTNRWQRVQDCLDTAGASTTDHFVPAPGQRVYVITSPGVDLAGWENVGAIGADNVPLPEIAHEFGHGIGLNHSWSNDITWKDATWATGGEYDNPWDLMSAANVFVDPTGAFGGGPPYLDAHHLDELGWIPKSRILTLGVDGILSRTVTLTALSHPGTSGYLLVRIPFDPSDRFHYYTVEYRTADSWDSGIPANIVLINEVKDNGHYYQTTLIRQLGRYAGHGNGPPVQSIAQNGVMISVVGTSGSQATIRVSTSFALRCAQGYVWREASSIDRVCVTPATRTATATDNAHAASRHLPNSTTCVQGYVWRGAFPGDRVCVTPATRAQTHADNANAYAHVNETLVTYGPNTCKNGFVWRDGDDDDYVCVTPATRARTLADNAAAGMRHIAGSETCKPGFVWREAWTGDHVCVTPATRSQASDDDNHANQHLWKSVASLPTPRRTTAAASMLNFITTAEAAEPKGGAHSPAPMSEAVMRVRLQKLGYNNVEKLERKGFYWDATVIKNKTKRLLRFDLRSGAMSEHVMPR